ncbi:MAG TPA: ABC transporter permease, partial [Thermoanaerobaculia bacterium]|nr:ABC transporter permease [Thermoanaerobaculia bacterium]
MDTFALDLRIAARALMRRPAFTAVAVVTLALGIGANTALFSVVHAVLLRPLPFRDAERLVHVTSRVVGSDFELTSGGDFLDWRDQSRLLSGVAAYTGSEGFTLRQDDRSERIQGALVSANFLTVFGVRPAQGRTFLPVEEKLQGGHSVLVSQRLWDRLFGAGTRLAGQTLRLDDEVWTIAGVLPHDFLFPRAPEIDILEPLVLDEAVERGREQMSLVQVIGRLAPEASVGSAHAELAAIQKRAEAAMRERLEANPGEGAPPRPPGGGMRGGMGGQIVRRMGPGPGGGPGRPPGLPETLLIVQPMRDWL